MNDRTVCDAVRRDIAAYRSGWLERSRADEINAHLARCQDCAAELHRDERLESALEAMPQMVPPTVTWAEVQTSRSPAPRARAFRQPALALSGAVGAATLAVVLLATHPLGVGTHPVPARGASVGSSGIASGIGARPDTPDVAQTFPTVLAHNMISAGETTGDPNRDIILMYGSGSQRKVVR